MADPDIRMGGGRGGRGGGERSSRRWDNKGLKIRGAGPPGFSPRFATETLVFNPGDHKGLVSFFIWCVILLNFTAPSTIPFKDQCLFWHNYFRTLHQVNYYGLLGWEKEREGKWGNRAWVQIPISPSLKSACNEGEIEALTYSVLIL